VPVPALRRLDDAGALIPRRSPGGQRRDSRHQLERAERLLALISEGTSIASAGRIVDLEREVADLRDQLSAPEPSEPAPDE
jgi:DNA-binding transcriptional MerR regulator